MGNQLNTNQIKNGHTENHELDLMNTNKPETLYNIKRKNKDQINLNLLTDLNPDDNLEMVIKSRKIQPIHKKQFSHVDVINQKNPIPSPFYQSNQQIRFDDELKVNSSVISQVNNSSIDDYKLNEFLQVIKNDAQQDFQKLEELENNENNKNDQTNNQTRFLENQKSFKQDQTIQNQQEQENEDQQQKEFKQIEIAPLRKKNYFASNNYELIVNQHNQQNKQQITDEETLFKLIQNNKPISEFVSGNQRQIIKNIMSDYQDEIKDQLEQEKKDGMQRQKIKIVVQKGKDENFSYIHKNHKQEQLQYHAQIKQQQLSLQQQQLKNLNNSQQQAKLLQNNLKTQKNNFI